MVVALWDGGSCVAMARGVYTTTNWGNSEEMRQAEELTEDLLESLA